MKKPRTFRVLEKCLLLELYQFEKGIRLKKALKNAGGLTKDADRQSIFITYPNGKSMLLNNNFISNPKVVDGATIKVGRKEEQEPLDVTEFLTVASIVADFAQVLAILTIARN